MKPQLNSFLELNAPCPSDFGSEKFSELEFGISVAAVTIFPAVIYALMIFLTRDIKSKVWSLKKIIMLD